MTSTRSPRSRRVVAAALALPLSLAMTGSALASGGSTVQLRGSETGAHGAGSPRAAAEQAVGAPVAATARSADRRGAQETADQPAPAAKAPVEPAPARDASSGPAQHGSPASDPQPLSKADERGTGANPGTGTCGHSSCSTRDGSASGNGAGDGEATGKPCAGCVGKAGNKNPKGQGQDGSDRNAGYECDRNQGIGKTNPAHTGCTPSTTTPTIPPGDGGPVTAFCPGTTIPMSAGGAKSCPSNGGSTPGTGAERVTICHATGSASNPYVMITPSKKGVLNGHVGSHHHGGRDVIPPFSYTEGGTTHQFGGQGDQSILATGCVLPTAGGASPEVELCPGGSVMPGGNPASCPTSPPVCPVETVVGPVMAGCDTDVPPTDGGGSPIDGVTPDQPAEGPIDGVTPGQPATKPVPVGPPTTVPPHSVPIAIVPNTAVVPTELAGGTPVAGTGAVPRALPFTGTDAALLGALGLVLLLGGGGILVAARKERTARAT